MSPLSSPSFAPSSFVSAAAVYGRPPCSPSFVALVRSLFFCPRRGHRWPPSPWVPPSSPSFSLFVSPLRPCMAALSVSPPSSPSFSLFVSRPRPSMAAISPLFSPFFAQINKIFAHFVNSTSRKFGEIQIICYICRENSINQDRNLSIL